MSRIGLDVKFTGGTSQLGADPVSTLERVAELGFEGVLVRTLLDAFPTLDAGDLARFGRRATGLDMFVQVGIGKVNPAMLAELPEVRRLGDGDYLLGMRRLVEAAASQGWTHLWTTTANYQRYPGLHAIDRFRTDITWQRQLRVIGEFLARLAPVLRQHGMRCDIETHEEITPAEVVDLVRAAGEDVYGVCFDTANTLVRGMTPERAAELVAPLIGSTHVRDAVLELRDGVLVRQLRPIGEGDIDWPALLRPLLEARPDLDFVVEGVGGTRVPLEVPIDDEQWRAAHPEFDASDAEEMWAFRARRDERSQAPPRVDNAVDDYLDFVSTSRRALAAHLSNFAA